MCSVCMSSVFGGWARFENNRLVFQNAGGFEAVPSLNEDEDPDWAIQPLDYEPSDSLFESKGILLKGDIYEIDSVFVNPLNTSSKVTHDPKMATKNDSPGKLTNQSKNTGEFPDTERLVTINWDHLLVSFEHPDTKNYIASKNISSDELNQAIATNTYLVIGESPKSFMSFGNVATRNWLNDLYIDSNKRFKSNAGVVLQAEGRNIEIKQNSAVTPGITLIPKYIISKSDAMSGITIGTTTLGMPLTVDGDLEVEGSLLANKVPGVKARAESPSTLQFGATTGKLIVEKEFKVEFIPSSILIIGSINSESVVNNRHGKQEIYLDLKYKRNQQYTNVPATWTEISNMRNSTSRKFQGSWSQSSSSLVTQFTTTLPACINTNQTAQTCQESDYGWSSDKKHEVTYRVQLLLNLENGDYRKSGNQNQLLVIGLPGAPLGDLPEAPLELEQVATMGDSIQIGEPAKGNFFTKNSLMFGKNNTNSENSIGFSVLDDTITLTDGSNLGDLRVGKLHVEGDRTKIKVMKSLGRGYPQFKIQAISFGVTTNSTEGSKQDLYTIEHDEGNVLNLGGSGYAQIGSGENKIQIGPNWLALGKIAPMTNRFRVDGDMVFKKSFIGAYGFVRFGKIPISQTSAQKNDPAARIDNATQFKIPNEADYYDLIIMGVRAAEVRKKAMYTYLSIYDQQGNLLGESARSYFSGDSQNDFFTFFNILELKRVPRTVGYLKLYINMPPGFNSGVNKNDRYSQSSFLVIGTPAK